MLARTFLPRHLVRHLYGTEPFIEYCGRRRIAFDQMAGNAMAAGDFQRWRDSVRALPEARQAAVGLELARVSELADPDAVALLTEAARGRRLPPATVPGDAARSLWFFLHHPSLFRDVLLGREIAEVDAWRAAQGPTTDAADRLVGRDAALAECLREFFRPRGDAGHFCVVDAAATPAGVCFVAHLSDRLRLLDVFTDDGDHTTRAARPAVAVIFLYEPATGRILLRTRLRSRDRVLGLVQRFAEAVLGAELPDDCLRPPYRLDVLKHRFDPPADAGDMESVRVKSLHLAYPEHAARRRVKLETVIGDHPRAIERLLRDHAGVGHAVDDLSVVYAEVEVWLRIAGRRKPYVIRLWPDRAGLGHTPLGRRFHACLRRWGLTHAA